MKYVNRRSFCILLLLILTCSGCSNETHQVETQQTTKAVIQNDNEYKLDYSKSETNGDSWKYKDSIWLPKYEYLDKGILDFYGARIENSIESQGLINSVDGLGKISLKSNIAEEWIAMARREDGNRVNTNIHQIASYKSSDSSDVPDVLCLTFAMYEEHKKDFNKLNVEVYSCEESYELGFVSERDFPEKIKNGELKLLNKKQISKTSKLYIDVDGFRKNNSDKKIIIITRSYMNNDDLTRIVVNYEYLIENREAFDSWMKDNEDISLYPKG